MHFVLPCAHIVEVASIDTLPTTCPMCSKKHNAADVAEDVAITYDGPDPDTLTTRTDAQEEYVLCRDCETERCTMWCDDCEGGMPYCWTCCEKAHTTRRQLQHRRYELSKAARGVVQCRHHKGERYMMYCRECARGLCAQCVSEQVDVHEGHTLLPLASADKDIKEQISLWSLILKDIDAKCAELAEDAMRETARLDASVTEEKRQMELAREALHRVVDDRIDVVRESLISHHGALREDLYRNPIRLLAVYRTKIRHYLSLFDDLSNRPADAQAHGLMPLLDTAQEVKRFTMPNVAYAPLLKVITEPDVYQLALKGEGLSCSDEVSRAIEAIRGIGLVFDDSHKHHVTATASAPSESAYIAAHVASAGGCAPSVASHNIQSWAHRYESAMVGICGGVKQSLEGRALSPS